jgi:putative peptidoglycan lipid II flippase
VILPNLSQKHAKASTKEFSATIDWALRLAVIVTVPAMMGLIVLAGPILTTLFQYDAFRPDDVSMASYSLVAYSLGLPAFIAVKVLAPGYYARQDTRTPVKIAIAAMVTNMVLNLAFVGALMGVGFAGPHAGLALASSIAAYLNAGLLYLGLRRRQVYEPEHGWLRVWLAVIVACAAMAALLVFITGDLQSWFEASAALRIRNLALTIGSGTLIYAIIGLITGLRKHDLLRGSR